VSQLHSSLHRLSYIRPNLIPGDNVYHFRMRSHNILNNWAPSLRKDLIILQWVMKGTTSLLYIPVNEGEWSSTGFLFFTQWCLNLMRNCSYLIILALRESPDALNMAYGLHENFQLEDTCATSKSLHPEAQGGITFWTVQIIGMNTF